MRTIVTIFFLHCFIGSLLSQKNNNTHIGDQNMERISKEINKLTFNYNLHFHPAYTQSQNRVENFYGPVQSETHYSENKRIKEIKYNQAGQVLSIKNYKGDTLYNEYLYQYDQTGNINSERGKYEVDYYSKDSNNMIGLAISPDRKRFYRAKDSIFIYKEKEILEIRRNIKNGDDITEKYRFKFTFFGELETIDIFSNNVRYGQIKNIFGANNRIKEHLFYHSFSSFSLTSKWASNFRNTAYLFEYDKNGFWSKIVREEYNAKTRRWEPSSKTLKYKIKSHNNGYTINKEVSKGAIKINYIIELDSQCNWIGQSIKSKDDLKIIKREIKYFN